MPSAEVPEVGAHWGVLELPGGKLTACGVGAHRFEDEDAEDEAGLAIPLGSLGGAWPEVEGFPFGVGEEVEYWEPRLESVLVELALHVYERAPFRRGLTGFEGIWFDHVQYGPVPAERPAGILHVADGEVVWHPPTNRSGFEFGPRKGSGP